MESDIGENEKERKRERERKKERKRKRKREKENLYIILCASPYHRRRSSHTPNVL